MVDKFSREHEGATTTVQIVDHHMAHADKRVTAQLILQRKEHGWRWDSVTNVRAFPPKFSSLLPPIRKDSQAVYCRRLSP